MKKKVWIINLPKPSQASTGPEDKKNFIAALPLRSEESAAQDEIFVSQCSCFDHHFISFSHCTLHDLEIFPS